MNEKQAILAVFAHPDDESLVAGGTLAMHARAGARVSLICATNGEWGPISDEALADYETLGDVRRRELRAACDVLGVNRLQFLDLPDAGVTWLEEEEAAAAQEKIVREIRMLRPAVVMTFGPDGLYAHEDHMAIGALTQQACALADEATAYPEHLCEGLAPFCPEQIYLATFPDQLLSTLVSRCGAAGLPADLWAIAPEQFGVPANQITTVIDVQDFAETKLAALRCHRTQMTAGHAFSQIPVELFAELMGREYFIAVDGRR